MVVGCEMGEIVHDGAITLKTEHSTSNTSMTLRGKRNEDGGKTDGGVQEQHPQ